jgi:hypothetical protein
MKIIPNYANIKLPKTPHHFPRFSSSELKHDWLCSMKFYTIYFNITQPAHILLFSVYIIATRDFVFNR